MIKSRKSCRKYDTALAWRYWVAREYDECAELLARGPRPRRLTPIEGGED